MSLAEPKTGHELLTEYLDISTPRGDAGEPSGQRAGFQFQNSVTGSSRREIA
jgi:hypothetical protein